MKNISENHSELFFGIIFSKDEDSLTHHLKTSILAHLASEGVNESHIEVIDVPSNTDTPFVANMLASTGRFNAIIICGLIDAEDVLVREMTTHAVAQILQSIAIQFEMPVINGIIDLPFSEQADTYTKTLKAEGERIARHALEIAVLGNDLKTRLDALEALHQISPSTHDDSGYGSDDFIES